MRLAFIIVVCSCFAGVFPAAAQPGGKVYLDATNKTRDTLDFDITLFGKPLSAHVIVENTGTTTITIPQKSYPFFAIERFTTDINDTRHFEFANDTTVTFPFAVSVAKVRDTFPLRFISNPDTADFNYALGFKIARLIVGLRESGVGGAVQSN